MTTTPTHRHLVATLLVAASAVTLTGPPASATTTGPKGTTATRVTLTYDSTAKKLTGFPTTLKGGLTTFSITGGAYGVSLLVARDRSKHDDTTIAKAVQAQDIPTWAALYGGTLSGARQGVTRSATLNLDKGSYIWSLSSDGSQLDGQRLWARFTVTGEQTSPAQRPSAVAIRLKEYAIELTGFRAGSNSVTYTNIGTQNHHAVFFKLKPGKTIHDAVKDFSSQGEPTAVDTTSGIELPALSPGLTETLDLPLTAGSWAAVCFLPDAQGKPHLMSGMAQQLDVR